MRNASLAASSDPLWSGWNKVGAEVLAISLPDMLRGSVRWAGHIPSSKVEIQQVFEQEAIAESRLWWE
jgi:hypothetical protein